MIASPCLKSSDGRADERALFLPLEQRLVEEVRRSPLRPGNEFLSSLSTDEDYDSESILPPGVEPDLRSSQSHVHPPHSEGRISGCTHSGRSFRAELTSVLTGTSCMRFAGNGFKRGNTSCGWLSRSSQRS